ncbi:MAG: undecaprenyl-diphosphate phosphatase [Candidatus Nanogingivalaceae bacterium]|jgi:undecaprenyl-diphosphatase uppP|nr:undecaprenyl-diphosphate phosphatase [Candidatus Nanogingivalaceae bacterium]
MEWWQAIILGIVEGVTEFLPVSSTGHLTIVEKLMGMRINDPSLTAFTAIIQVGAIIAAIVYFWDDIWRVLSAWWRGLWWKRARRQFDYKYGWAIIIGSVPIAIVGYLFKDEVETVLRSLWFVAFALIGWSAVMWIADKHSAVRRGEKQTTWRDTLAIGFGQCLALIPGVSRSGATISIGLFRGFDRVTVTKLSFFLGIPALVAAGLLEVVTEHKYIAGGVGWGSTILATIVSFVVGYFSIAWLLKFVSNNDFSLFIKYRVGLGALIIVLLAAGAITAI